MPEAVWRIIDRQSFVSLEFLSAVKPLEQKNVGLWPLLTVDLNTTN